MMTNLITQLSSPRPSSGYGSSEDEQNFLFHRHPTSGLVTPTSDLSTSSSGLWISTSGLFGRTSCPSTPTSNLSTPTISDDSSCPVTPDSVTSVVEFPPVFDLFDGVIGLGSDGGFFAGDMNLGDLCAREELTDLRGPLLNDLPCLGFDLEFGDSTDCSELCYNTDEYLHHDGNILAALLKRPWSLYPHARDIKTEAPSPCASADPVIASHQMANCSAPGEDWPLDRLARLTRVPSSTVRGVTDELALPGNRCHRQTSSPATISRTLGEYAKKPSNFDQGKTGVRGVVRLSGGAPVASNLVKHTANISTDTEGTSGHTTTTTARTRPYLTGNGQSSAASVSRTSTGCRRNFSELDDHRYSSSPHSYGPPPTKISRLTRTSRPTILETFLLTKEPLRANAGSDAMLAVNGVAQLHRKSSLSSVHFPEGKSVLEGLLTETNNYARGREATVSDPAGVAFDPKRTVTSATGSNPKPSTPEPTKRVEVNAVKNQISRKSSSSSLCRSQLIENNCDLLSDHLFVECDAVQLALTSADDGIGQGWIPSRHDDRVFSSEVDDILRQQFLSDDLLMHPFLSDLLCEPKTF